MRAVIHRQYGPPDVLRLVDIPRPEPRAGEILVRVVASTVNRSDCGFRAATPAISRLFTGLSRPRRPRLGTEFSGVVAGLGEGVANFAEGDAVFGRTQDFAMGAWAEYLTVPADGAVALKPGKLTFAEAAALCDGAMLAGMYLALVDFNRQRRVLINGGSGAIGSAAVQLAKARGATVTAVCKTETVEIVRALGADRVIDYRKEDFTRIAGAFDVVFDAVGKSSYGACRRLLPDGGIFMATDLGPFWQNPFLALKTALFGGRIKVYFPVPSYRAEQALQLAGLAEQGRYAPLIDRAYPLEEIVAASEYVETGEKIGNVLIAVTGEAGDRSAMGIVGDTGSAGQ